MALAVKPRASIEGQHFHVVVIGGGINGVAIARECARAGKRTLLVEQNDFGSGVTSRSTRVIHGGLRYLEYGELDLVRESVRERERLLRERSHLVQPLQFLFLLNENSQRSPLKVRTGLWLYQRLSGKKSKNLSAPLKGGAMFSWTASIPRVSLNTRKPSVSLCNIWQRALQPKRLSLKR